MGEEGSNFGRKEIGEMKNAFPFLFFIFMSPSQLVHGPREDLHLLEVDVHELHAGGRAGLRGHGARLHRVAHHLAHGVSARIGSPSREQCWPNVACGAKIG